MKFVVLFLSGGEEEEKQIIRRRINSSPLILNGIKSTLVWEVVVVDSVTYY